MGKAESGPEVEVGESAGWAGGKALDHLPSPFVSAGSDHQLFRSNKCCNKIAPSAGEYPEFH